MSGVEHELRDETLLWVRNPFTGAVTYFTEVHRKRSGFVRAPESAPAADPPAPPERARMDAELAACPFCPGNEGACSDEVLRLRRSDVYAGGNRDEWLVRAVRNIVPRVPEVCTGGRNESYVVIEDPRHFVDAQQGPELLRSGLLDERHFQELLLAEREVARRAHANPAVRSVLLRKNQGRQSGASQPHLHSQVIGADREFPAVERERALGEREPAIWDEIVAFVRRLGFMVDEGDGIFSYFCPFGAFPRSYEIVSLADRSRIVDVPEARLRSFASRLHAILRQLGPVPLDYEIHDGPGVPLHVHVNTRHFPYSNVGGTLNLPVTLAEDPRLAREVR